MKKQCVVFDTDVGTDDAMAFLAWKIVPFKPDFIIAEHGNTTLEGAYLNAGILKILLDLDAVIVKGIDAAVKNEEKNTFHGFDGLGNTRERLIQEALRKCGSQAVFDERLKESLDFPDFKNSLAAFDAITYIVTGPLTNLVSLIGDSDLRKKISHVYVMGGGIGEFNCANDTEFNFSKDPESVNTVLESGLDITLFPLDLTNHQHLSAEDIDSLAKISAYDEFVDFLRFNLSANKKYNQINGAVLHDVMPVLYLNPVFKKMFRTVPMKLSCDQYGRTYSDEKGSEVAVVMDVEKQLLLITMACVFTELYSAVGC